MSTNAKEKIEPTNANQGKNNNNPDKDVPKTEKNCQSSEAKPRSLDKESSNVQDLKSAVKILSSNNHNNNHGSNNFGSETSTSKNKSDAFASSQPSSNSGAITLNFVGGSTANKILSRNNGNKINSSSPHADVDNVASNKNSNNQVNLGPKHQSEQAKVVASCISQQPIRVVDTKLGSVQSSKKTHNDTLVFEGDKRYQSRTEKKTNEALSTQNEFEYQEPTSSISNENPSASKSPMSNNDTNASKSNRINNNSNNNYRNAHQQHNHQHELFNSENLSRTNLYIRGLEANTTDSDLYELCKKFGNIVSTKAILDKLTNKCKGYGFVDFQNSVAAELAVTELSKQGIWAHMAKQQEADPTNLYIANLPLSMGDDDLGNLLNPFGPVTSTRVLIDPLTKQSRGVGFARMKSKEQCDEIITQLNGRVLKGAKEPLLVKFADGANKRRSNHHNNHNHNHYQQRNFSGWTDQAWRSNNNPDNIHQSMSNPSSNRNFHGNSFDHPRQNHSIMNANNGTSKHSQHISSIPGYQGHQQTTHSHLSPNMHLNQTQQHQTGHHQLGHHQQHHAHSQSSQANHRNQNSASYTGPSSYSMSASMSAASDPSHWMHQAGQPYVIQPQLLHPTPLHYMNLANQMQGLQINPSVAGYMSPQQWSVWPNVNAKHSAGANHNATHGGSAPNAYSETD